MRAVILAGGEGTRLRPMTCNIPKPLAKLCSKPVLEYILDLLSRNGIKQAVITLMYKGERIEEAFPDGVYKDVSLEFVYENEPLGTAGCVKNAAPGGEEVLVISGDAMCDFDLKAAIDFHRSQSADATVITKRVKDPREYGLVLKDGENRITGFLEKPSFCSCTSDEANTGIYILSPSVLGIIPEGKKSDFALDIFPKMLSDKMKLMCFEERGYWCDIGDFEAYLKCQSDMLEGKVDFEIDGHKNLDGVITLGTFENVTVKPPAFIGDNVKIGEGTVIEAGTVIGSNITIGRNCKIHSSVILDGAFIGDGATCNSAVICENAGVMAGASVFENAVVGSGAVIGRDAVVESGVKIWPNRRVERGVRARLDLKYGRARRMLCDENGLCGEAQSEVTPENAAKIGNAAARLAENKMIGVGSGFGECAEALRLAFIAGAMSAGVNVADFGDCTLPQLEFCSGKSGIKISAHLEADKNVKIRFCTTGGLPLTRKQERALEGALNRNDSFRVSMEDFGEYVRMYGFTKFYEQELSLLLPDRLCGINAKITGENPRICANLSEALSKISDANGEETEFFISGDGRSVFAKTESGEYISHERLVMLACDRLFKEGKAVSLPSDFPAAAETLAKKYGAKVLRYSPGGMGEADDNARRAAENLQFVSDGSRLAVKVLIHLHNEKLTLSEAVKAIPDFYMQTREIPLKTSPVKLMSKMKFAEERGVLNADARGRVWVRPEKGGLAVLMFSESTNSEIARELCDEFEEKIKNLDQMSEKN